GQGAIIRLPAIDTSAFCSQFLSFDPLLLRCLSLRQLNSITSLLAQHSFALHRFHNKTSSLGHQWLSETAWTTHPKLVVRSVQISHVAAYHPFRCLPANRSWASQRFCRLWFSSKHVIVHSNDSNAFK